MPFPALPRDVTTEVYVNGNWVDVSNDVYLRDPIMISRGRPNEAGAVTPSALGLTLKNTSGNYSPDNPVGIYYGSFGQNTPIRIGIVLAKDTFSRSVSNGWGSMDTGQSYTNIGAGGSVLTSDFNVTGSLGTFFVPVALAYRISYLAATAYADVDVAVTVNAAVSIATGGAFELVNILLRGQDTVTYYRVRVTSTTSGSITLDLLHSNGTPIASAVTVAGLTQAIGLFLRVRAQTEGQEIRAKVWDASLSEPYGWHITGNSTLITSAGWVGIRASTASGNTNVPITFNYDNLIIRHMRFAGEISALPLLWNEPGTDMYVPLEGAGPLRRLGAGASPLRSPLYRAILADNPAPIVYWPLEDPEGSPSFASGLTTGSPMKFSGVPKLAAHSDFVGSAPLLTLGSVNGIAVIPDYSVTSTLQVSCLLFIPSEGAPELDGQAILRFITTGTASRLELAYQQSGTLVELNVYDSVGTQLMSPGFLLNRSGHYYLVFRFVQSGSNVLYTYEVLGQGSTVLSTQSGTLTGRTFGRVTQVIINPASIDVTSDVSLGHIHLHTYFINTLNERHDPFNAHITEVAGRRLERICFEESIPFSYAGDLDATSRMGYQPVTGLVDLLNDCAEADLGTLTETRSTIGLLFRTRTSLYSQVPQLTLNYANQEVASPFSPTRDDQNLRNDVTVSREGGPGYRVEQTTGPFAVVDPQDGGIGRYDTSISVNIADDFQLQDLASWLLLVGTTNEPRYRVISILLHSTLFSSNTSLTIAALDHDVDDCLQINNPKSGQAPGPIKQLVRGYQETLSAVLHTLSFNCAPESPYHVIILNQAGVKIDSSSSYLTQAESSTDTSWSVTTTNPLDLWTTNAADFPLDVIAAGEVVRVTNITGSTSPQTFTVTRSMNGVVKAQTALTPVQLAQPAIIAV